MADKHTQQIPGQKHFQEVIDNKKLQMLRIAPEVKSEHNNNINI